jgi:hypothetical protein
VRHPWAALTAKFPFMLRMADGTTGTLDLEIEPFVKIEQDSETRTALLSVEDQNTKNQKEMWGAHLPSFFVVSPECLSS